MLASKEICSLRCCKPATKAIFLPEIHGPHSQIKGSEHPAIEKPVCLYFIPNLEDCVCHETLWSLNVFARVCECLEYPFLSQAVPQLLAL